MSKTKRYGHLKLWSVYDLMFKQAATLASSDVVRELARDLIAAQREVSTLTTEILDGLEDLADELDRDGNYTVNPAELRALIDCARDALQMRADAVALRDRLAAMRKI